MVSLLHVSSRGQIVIPEPVRKRFQIAAGSDLILLEKDDTLIIRKAEDVEKHLSGLKPEDDSGWIALAERSLEKVWNNAKDEKIWKKYL